MNFRGFKCFILLVSMIFPVLLVSEPVQIDYAIFLFDNGEKNMVASMLKYAEDNDKEALQNLDFRIVFMGASIDAMGKEPFCHYPEKLIHYKQLGIEETIDHLWKRDRRLRSETLKELSKHLEIKKKLWTGVSCSIFEQLVVHYQETSGIEVVALRDNPVPLGDTDYFTIANAVQNAARKLAIPSTAVSSTFDPLQKQLVVIGHSPIEEWKDEAEHIDKDAVMRRLGINPKRPIIVYAGVYGDFYQKCFEQFLEIVPEKDVQVLIVPHPRYKGAVEIQTCPALKRAFPYLKIVGEFMEDPSQRIKTIEALRIADLVVTADATSTVVFQANALRKRVLYVNNISSEVTRAFSAKKLIYPISSREEFASAVRLIAREQSINEGQDVFEMLGIPKQGAKLLWTEWRK